MRSPPMAVMAVAALLLLVSLAANTTASPDRESKSGRNQRMVKLYERVMVEWKAGHGKNIRNEEETRRVFAEWMVEYGKKYSSAGEEDRRYALFKDELRRVDLLNAAFGPNPIYGINFLSDITDKEWRFLSEGALPYESTKPISQDLQRRQEWRFFTQGVAI
uniref:Predicted protein n=1 Tax=Hordeum vulgare subsp. vulgare TaxID=112509 RepID=F2D0T1_HORVV|nr:predicted protein [Hordeum vulgare subsp. vulgare]